MKKHLFFMGVALVALASCSNEEVVDINKGDAINFRVAMGNGANSRATETTTSNFAPNGITVNAYLSTGTYFEDAVFTAAADGKYTHTPEFYWPKQDVLTFYALPYNVAAYASASISDAGIAFNSYAPAANVKEQQDLVASSATGSSQTANVKDNGLALAFKHILSQIQVKAKNTNSNYKFTIAGIKIGNVLEKGDCAFTTSADWAAASDAKLNGEYTVDLANNVVLSTALVDGTNDVEAFDIMDLTALGGAGAMLIPQDLSTAGRAWDGTKEGLNSGAYLAVKLNITMTGTGLQIYPDPVDGATEPAFAYAYIPLDTNWVPGTKYVYTLDFSKGAGKDDQGDDILDGAIILTTSVEGWIDETKDVTL